MTFCTEVVTWHLSLTNDASTGSIGTLFGDISIKTRTFSLKNTYLKMSSAKLRLFRFGVNMSSNGIIILPELSIAMSCGAIEQTEWSPPIVRLTPGRSFLSTNPPFDSIAIGVHQGRYRMIPGIHMRLYGHDNSNPMDLVWLHHISLSSKPVWWVFCQFGVNSLALII